MATEFTRAGLTFDVTESGPPDGETVLLLHGFPQHRSSWDALVPILNDAGYRTIAFDQRGYSPRARPKRRFDYRMPELVADAKAAIDQLAGGRAHVVGHDWGSAAAWSLAAQEPASVASLTAVSVPHPFAFLRSMVTTRQGVRSWYMYLFQLPWLPELLLRTQWKRSLVDYGRQTPALAERDRAAFTGPGALTGPLNWRRLHRQTERRPLRPVRHGALPARGPARRHPLDRRPGAGAARAVPRAPPDRAHDDHHRAGPHRLTDVV
jgi:pimeloyl-ACP methyl ester carboxylesterase